MRERGLAIAVLTCAYVLAGMAGWASPASARDAVVTSFDGTPLVVHFFGPATEAPDGRAPTVLVGATYPSPGETRAELDVGDRIGLATLRNAGFNVVTFDPRGLGGSGGLVMFDSPAFEARDARAIIDFVAAQPEALLDAPGDPRVGMSGTSYGAGIQLLAAALDRRVDAIVPDLGWHSLTTALHRDGAVKTGWLAALCGLDVVAGAVDGKASAGDVRPPTASPELKAACLEGVAGAPSNASAKWLADRGPGALVKQIRAPALLTQGTQDTLFSLDEAIANHAALRDSGVPVKMIWYCGGHVACPTPAGDPRHVARAGLAWLNRWLRGDAAVDTGPAFEWQADDGAWRSGPDFPLAPAGTLDAVGSGTLKIAARDSPARGLGRSASPARNAVRGALPRPVRRRRRRAGQPARADDLSRPRHARPHPPLRPDRRRRPQDRGGRPRHAAAGDARRPRAHGRATAGGDRAARRADVLAAPADRRRRGDVRAAAREGHGQRARGVGRAAARRRRRLRPRCRRAHARAPAGDGERPPCRARSCASSCARAWARGRAAGRSRSSCARAAVRTSPTRACAPIRAAAR